MLCIMIKLRFCTHTVHTHAAVIETEGKISFLNYLFVLVHRIIKTLIYLNSIYCYKL